MLSDRHQADELPHINMTPMVDVVLCLLVFFMAATRLYDWDESEFAVNVPEVADAAPLTAAPDDLVLTIVKPGKVAVGETTYDLDGLADLLREARGRYADQGVVIRGDATLTYQDLADVLSACDAAGIRNVRLPVGRASRDGRRATAPLIDDDRSDDLDRPRPASGRDVDSRNGAVMELLRQLVRRPCSTSAPTSINALAAHGRAVALRDPVRDHLRRDRAGRDRRSCRATRCCSPSAPSPRTRTRRSICGCTAVLLIVAAVLGDAVNYAIGYHVGPRVFSSESRGS